MAQVKIYALETTLADRRPLISDTIHSCLVEVLKLPLSKRFHRFIPLEKHDFIYPEDRSDNYLILEISMFKGRSDKCKKQLIKLLFSRFAQSLSWNVNDLEITIFETPRQNWGIRGKPGDELTLPYKVEQQ